MRALDYGWRFFATGVCFSLFGVGGVLLAVIFFPAVNLVIRDPDRRESIAQATVHYVWRAYLGLLSLLGILDLDLPDRSVFAGERGTVIIANHPTLLDIVLLMSLIKNAQCVIKEGVWRNPVMRGVVRAANYVPNHLGDPEGLLQDCGACLAKGNNMIIFPEGSRSVPGEPRRYQRGFANIAIRNNAPIRLITITCDPPTLLKGERWYEIPPRRPKFVLRVRERIDIENKYQEVPPSRAVRDLTELVAARFERLLGDEPT